jgi:hypothetical protein
MHGVFLVSCIRCMRLNVGGGWADSLAALTLADILVRILHWPQPLGSVKIVTAAS